MKKIPKINSNAYGWKRILLSVLIGGALPLLIRLITGKFLWQLCVAGGLILAVFLCIFLVEMRQDFGKVPYYEKHLKEQFPFDPGKQEAVMKVSICTGEKVAGFRDLKDGHFTEVMLVRTQAEEERLKEIYGISTLKNIY